MEDAVFEELVVEGARAIPKKFLSLLDNVELVIQDDPTPEQKKQLRLHAGLTLFGLYEGVPRVSRGIYDSGRLPDKITIFKNPIIAAARGLDEIKAMVRDTVWHEIGHHFGMSEEQIRRAERRRSKR